jgi:hypothetical protein
MRIVIRLISKQGPTEVLSNLDSEFEIEVDKNNEIQGNDINNQELSLKNCVNQGLDDYFQHVFFEERSIAHAGSLNTILLM